MENGYLHVQITSPDGDFDADGRTKASFQLSSLPQRRFNSVPSLVNYCAQTGIYATHLPPTVLKHPLADSPL